MFWHIGKETCDLGLQPRAMLAHSPTDPVAFMQYRVFAHHKLGQDGSPDPGEPVIDHYNREQTRIDHVELVFVLDGWRQVDNIDDRLTGDTQSLVQRGKTFRVTLCLTHMHGLAGEILDGRKRRCARAGDDQHSHVGALGRQHEIREQATGGSRGEIAGGNVTEPRTQAWQQAIARRPFPSLPLD